MKTVAMDVNKYYDHSEVKIIKVKPKDFKDLKFHYHVSVKSLPNSEMDKLEGEDYTDYES